MNAGDLAIYEQMTVMTPSDELVDAVENLLTEVKRLREAVTQYSEKDAWYVAEVKRLRVKEADVIEYVIPLLATPGVLKQLMGSPSQIHTIVNLTASLEHLLYILRESEEE